jgi:hypothetical protein
MSNIKAWESLEKNGKVEKLALTAYQSHSHTSISLSRVSLVQPHNLTLTLFEKYPDEVQVHKHSDSRIIIWA